MSNKPRPRLAILYPGDRTARQRSDPAESRFLALFDAFSASGVAAEPAIYNDAFADEVLAQISQVQGVLVWHNPIEGGRDRATLDAMLREAARRGVLISAHPDVILKLGTKDVLLSVSDLPFGSDVHRIADLAQLQAELPRRLAVGPRVLKQQRGHSGIGIWRVEQRADGLYTLRHAQRGCAEEVLDFHGVVQRLGPHFDNAGHMIDQAWQPRMVEGMTRAYLVRGKVAGFGHQAVIALHPAAAGQQAPPAGPRLYSGANDPRFVELRQRLEGEWVQALCERVCIEADALPLLWDADFLLGVRANEAAERYVLCEINVSSVAPFPDSAIAPLVEATCRALTLRPPQ
ncbi:MAG: Cj0069 family protein [Burkholderiaceae bacterium]